MTSIRKIKGAALAATAAAMLMGGAVGLTSASASAAAPHRSCKAGWNGALSRR